jgi:hypothetical protein
MFCLHPCTQELPLGQSANDLAIYPNWPKDNLSAPMAHEKQSAPANGAHQGDFHVIENKTARNNLCTSHRIDRRGLC